MRSVAGKSSERTHTCGGKKKKLEKINSQNLSVNSGKEGSVEKQSEKTEQKQHDLWQEIDAGGAEQFKEEA